MSLTQNAQHARGVHRRGRMRLGEDILLARHGNNIQSMRLDRRADRMVATLRDGSVDCAANTVLAAAPSPLERLGAQVHAVREDTAAVSRADVRLLVTFSAVWLAISLVLTIGLVWAASATGSAGLLTQSMTYPAY